MSRKISPAQRLLTGWKPILSLAVGLVGVFAMPVSVWAEEEQVPLTEARINFIRNRVQLVPQGEEGRRAFVGNVLEIYDRLRTARASRAELEFNDGSSVRIGERAVFEFTPNTRNFELLNGTALLLIPADRGRSTIQTPNAVTGIQGSALFVRYIPETDTTIVGALTNNPEGPMVLFNRDGSEQLSLEANQVGVVQGDQITSLYEIDGLLFWQSSGLAEGFNYLSPSSTGSDALDSVRREVREALAGQAPLTGERVIENPTYFNRPGDSSSQRNTPNTVDSSPVSGPDSPDASANPDPLEDDLSEFEFEEDPGIDLEFKDSPAQEYLEGNSQQADNNLVPSVSADQDAQDGSTGGGQAASDPDPTNGADGMDSTPTDGGSSGENVIIADPNNGDSNGSDTIADDPSGEGLPPNALTDPETDGGSSDPGQDTPTTGSDGEPPTTGSDTPPTQEDPSQTPTDQAPTDQTPTDQNPTDQNPTDPSPGQDPVEQPIEQPTTGNDTDLGTPPEVPDNPTDSGDNFPGGVAGGEPLEGPETGLDEPPSEQIIEPEPPGEFIEDVLIPENNEMPIQEEVLIPEEEVLIPEGEVLVPEEEILIPDNEIVGPTETPIPQEVEQINDVETGPMGPGMMGSEDMDDETMMNRR